jgi:pyruvate dehydrogenase E1 component alpha subunit
MGTSVARAAAGVSLADRGHAYGIPGQQVDGMDVVAVKEAGSAAVKQARNGDGPHILEMMTYRYRGHSMSDPAKYRSKEEVEKMRTEHDPISRVRDLLQASGLSEDELKKIDREIRDVVADAADFAQTSPEPPESELWTDVLVEA